MLDESDQLSSTKKEDIKMAATIKTNRQPNRTTRMLETNDSETIFCAYFLPDLVIYQFGPEDIGTKEFNINIRFLELPALCILIEGEPFEDGSTYSFLIPRILWT